MVSLPDGPGALTVPAAVMMFPVSQTLEKSLAKDETLERNRGVSAARVLGGVWVETTLCSFFVASRPCS